MSNQVERRIPRVMERAASTAVSKDKVTAFANEVEGQCPICKAQMKLSSCNNVDVYVCIDHRVVMPIKNT